MVSCTGTLASAGRGGPKKVLKKRKKEGTAKRRVPFYVPPTSLGFGKKKGKKKGFDDERALLPTPIMRGDGGGEEKEKGESAKTPLVSKSHERERKKENQEKKKKKE